MWGTTWITSIEDHFWTFLIFLILQTFQSHSPGCPETKGVTPFRQESSLQEAICCLRMVVSGWCRLDDWMPLNPRTNRNWSIIYQLYWSVRRHFFRVTQQKDMQTLEGHMLFQATWALQLLWKQHIATRINSTQVRHCCHHQFATKFGPRTTLPSFLLVLSQTVSSWSKHTCCEILE